MMEELGFNNKCEDKNKLISLRFCNVMDDCDDSRSILEGLKIRKGKQGYKKHLKTAKKIIKMYQERDWSGLGL